MVTYKNLQDFIQLHKNELGKESLVVILDKNSGIFQVLRSTGNLNIDSFSFCDQKGNDVFENLLKRDGGVNSTGVVSIWGHPQPKLTLNDNIKSDRITTVRDVEHNVMFDRTGFQGIDSDQIEADRFGDDYVLTTCGVGPDFALVGSLEILSNVKYTKQDSWDHKSEGIFGGKMLAIVVGEALERKFKPRYESLVIEKFADFIKKDI